MVYVYQLNIIIYTVELEQGFPVPGRGKGAKPLEREGVKQQQQGSSKGA